MTPEIAVILFLLIAVLVVFAFEWLSVDVVSLSLLAILVLTGILTPQEAFSGFANEVIIILASIFILSGTLIKTGVTDGLAQFISWITRSGERRLLACVTCLVAFFPLFSAIPARPP